MKIKGIFFCVLLSSVFARAQGSKMDFTLFDGIAIMGYVDEGAFVNFTGPNVSLTSNNSKYILGMLPSLRFKEDKGTPKNSFITPNLGVGLTYCYKLLAVQVPVYYNTKTATTNGKWNVGIGVGMRLNFLNKKNN
jgi:hypothetical protein